MTTNPPSIAKSAATDSVNAGSDTTKSEQTDKSISFKWLFAVLGSISLSLLAFYYFIFGYRLEMGFGNQADFGAFGDFLGGVLNPIFGFATVGLLIWSLKMQRQALSVSNQELSLTRQELKETKQETALSRRAMQEQVAHFQQEAKLNELTRLLEKVHQSYTKKLNIPFPITQVNTLANGALNLSVSYGALMNLTFEPLTSPQKEALLNSINANHAIIKALNNMRYEVILISDLALKYYSINSSPEFARVHLKEAYELLISINRIYADDVTENKAQKIASILFNASDTPIAKVLVTEGSHS